MMCLFCSIFAYISWRELLNIHSRAIWDSLKQYTPTVYTLLEFLRGLKNSNLPISFSFFLAGGGGGGVEGTNRKGGYIPRASGADKLMDSCTYLIQRNLDITNVPV